MSTGLAVNVCETVSNYSVPACWSLQALLMALPLWVIFTVSVHVTSYRSELMTNPASVSHVP